MKFEDLTNAQLKKVIRNYRLHLLEGISGFSSFDREKLISTCKKFFDIDDEKIKPKITEPMYFDIPKERQPKVEKMKKEMKIKENKQIETISDKLINEFKKLSEEKKEGVAKSLTNSYPSKDEIKYYKFVKDYAYSKYRKYYDKLLFGLTKFSPNTTNEAQYLNSIMPYLKNRPEVIEANKTRFYAKKEKIMRPLLKELEDIFEENGALSRRWSKIFNEISSNILITE